jgi:hypothetical protein
MRLFYFLPQDFERKADQSIDSGVGKENPDKGNAVGMQKGDRASQADEGHQTVGGGHRGKGVKRPTGRNEEAHTCPDEDTVSHGANSWCNSLTYFLKVQHREVEFKSRKVGSSPRSEDSFSLFIMK